jgi:hypothetical protein
LMSHLMSSTDRHHLLNILNCRQVVAAWRIASVGFLTLREGETNAKK